MKNFCIITNPYKDTEYALTNKMKSYIELDVYKRQIIDVSSKVQEKVKSAIENMTGLEVSGVNIRIASVDMGKSR